MASAFKKNLRGRDSCVQLEYLEHAWKQMFFSIEYKNYCVLEKKKWGKSLWISKTIGMYTLQYHWGLGWGQEIPYAYHVKFIKDFNGEKSRWVGLGQILPLYKV